MKDANEVIGGRFSILEMDIREIDEILANCRCVAGGKD